MSTSSESSSSASYAARAQTPLNDVAELTYTPLDTSAIIKSVQDDGAGAIAVFIGTTRNSFQGKKVTRLDYSAYTRLAMTTMCSILTDARTLSNTNTIIKSAVHHRLGTVPVGEPSIIVVVSSHHRRESFEACEWILEQVKKKAQIWKQEWYEGERVEEADWKANFPSQTTSVNE